MDKIKWIEDKVGVEEQLWWRYNTVAFNEAMKITIKFPTLFRHSALGAYSEYKLIIEHRFKSRMDFFDVVFLEIWKRVAKNNYDTYVARIDKEVSEDDCLFLIREALKKIFPELKGYLHCVRKKMEIAERIGLAGYQKREDMASAEAKAAMAN